MLITWILFLWFLRDPERKTERIKVILCEDLTKKNKKLLVGQMD